MTANHKNSLIIESKYPKIDIPLVTISRFLIEKLRFFGNKTFLIDNQTKNSYTFNEVANDSLRMAQILTDDGLKDRENFGICGHNNYEFVTTLFGGLIVGGVAIPLNVNTDTDKISKLIKEKQIKFLTFLTRNQNSLSTEAFKRFNKGVKTVVSFSDELHLKPTEENETINSYESIRRPITSHKCHNESHIGVIKSVNTKLKNCLLVETNGSFNTSKSKSCLISDFSLLSQITVSSLPVTGFNWSSNDTVLNTTSFVHINGLIQLFSALASGSQFVIYQQNSETNSSNDLYRVIEEWCVSAAIFTPNTIINMIKDDNLEPGNIKSLKKVICTGSSLPKNIGYKFIDKFQIEDFRQAYGMTEMCGFATIEPIGSTDFETCGVPVPGVQIKIVDTDTGVILGATQVGEVYVKSQQLFSGYLNSGQNEKLANDSVKTIDSEGWFRTGDIGYYDQNNKLQIVDPIEDFILYRSLHISPTSLEAILLSHFAVREVTIFGTSNRIDGQKPTALVVLKPTFNNKEVNNNENITEMLRNYINDHLIQQNICFDDIYIVDEIPKTLSGKANRTDLRQFLTEIIGQIDESKETNRYLIDI